MKKIIVNLEERSYPVWIGELALLKIKQEMSSASVKRGIIIDRNVERLHGPKIRSVFNKFKGETEWFVLKSGENYKSLNQLNRIYKFMLDRNFGRDSVIYAIGGGVTGDIGGFAASTFKRGVSLVHIPTTLLAAIDSSIGGKTAINMNGRKNVVGTFYQPKGVITDLNFLETLPKQEFLSGIGELIKYTFMSDPNLFIYVLNNIKKILAADLRVLETIVYKCAMIKSSIVMKDEKEESGLRKILNFGHTFGHAFESVMKYKIKHGEAVVAGIISALYLSNKIGVLPDNRLITYLKLPAKMKIPSALKRLDPNDIVEAMKDDKKNKAGRINFVLLSEIGSLLIDVAASKDDILYSLDKLYSTI